jgi:hypothetical protein
MTALRVANAEHYGWAVAFTATADHEDGDRRRNYMYEPGVCEAPIHYESARLDVVATTALVAEVRASVRRVTAAGLDELTSSLAAPIASISLRTWPPEFPDDIAVQRRSPYEARADAIMYRQILAEVATARGWEVRLYDAKKVIDAAADLLGPRTDDVLQGPRARLGPPWTKDHRVALAATIVGGRPA